MYRISFLLMLSVALVPTNASSGLFTKGIGVGATLCLRAVPCRAWIGRQLLEKGITSIEACLKNPACSAYVVAMAKNFASGAGAGALEGAIPLKRSIPLPEKPKKGCTAICRADANDNIPGNAKEGETLFALGEATAPSCAIASKEAKRIATRKLGMQPKHLGCRTMGK
jgi:hypothetical protein